MEGSHQHQAKLPDLQLHFSTKYKGDGLYFLSTVKQKKRRKNDKHIS